VASAKPIAFINVPYARAYETVFLSLIAGAAGHGLVPTAAVHHPSSRFQLDRIYDLIASARYSFHDLSLMTTDRKPPSTPRLNMAFELGLAVALSRAPGTRHEWFVFDTVPNRLDKALSDLGGIRPRIHDHTPQSVLGAVMNALGRQQHRPTLTNLMDIYADLARVAREIKATYSRNLFETRPFFELSYTANRTARVHIPSLAAEGLAS
jgi:hypothetical protein